jgi:predicted permease
MAAAVGPAALFAVGLSLVGRKLVGNIGEVLWLAVLKAVINPILTFVLVTYAFVMEPLWSQAAVILSAMPVGTNPYVIAQQYPCRPRSSSRQSCRWSPSSLCWFAMGSAEASTRQARCRADRKRWSR